MEIKNPGTGAYIPLLGAFNFERKPLSKRTVIDQFSFYVDWTKGGRGQDILRQHIGFKSPMHVKWHGVEHRGVMSFEAGINTADGLVVADAQP